MCYLNNINLSINYTIGQVFNGEISIYEKQSSVNRSHLRYDSVGFFSMNCSIQKRFSYLDISKHLFITNLFMKWGCCFSFTNTNTLCHILWLSFFGVTFECCYHNNIISYLIKMLLWAHLLPQGCVMYVSLKNKFFCYFVSTISQTKR